MGASQGGRNQEQQQKVVKSIKEKKDGYRSVAGRIVFDMKTENFPGFYSTGSQCRWQVKIPDGYKMCYNIRIFRTERSRRCDRNNDVLVSFNSPDCQTSSLEQATVNFAMCGYLRRSFFKELNLICVGDNYYARMTLFLNLFYRKSSCGAN